jgi:hypothetical protein
MTKFHFAHREPNRRFKLVINLSAGVLFALAVGIFAVTKSAEGAWLLVIGFPALLFMLIRPNPQYRAVTSVVEMSRTERPEFAKRVKHRVFVFVDSADLADIQAVRYGQCLHADDLTAVHFVLDPARAARLQDYWDRFEHDTKLQMAVCPDRPLSLAAQELVRQAVDDHADTRVTVLFAQRTCAPLVGRLLHDRTADKLARLISRIPGATPQIVVYDAQARIARATQARRKSAAATSRPVEPKVTATRAVKAIKGCPTPESATHVSTPTPFASHDAAQRQRVRPNPARAEQISGGTERDTPPTSQRDVEHATDRART